MRVFIALDIEDAIRDRISRFMDGVREFAPDARWVRPESLHVTLKFIGEQPDPKLQEIERALAGIHAPSTTVSFRGYGFFPSPRSARVFWVGVEGDENLPRLAGLVERSLEPL